jgi:hypothetical protein
MSGLLSQQRLAISVQIMCTILIHTHGQEHSTELLLLHCVQLCLELSSNYDYNFLGSASALVYTRTLSKTLQRVSSQDNDVGHHCTRESQ